MLLADLVAATSDVAATRARSEKIARLADLLRSATADEVAVVVGVVAGDPRQGRIGVGWATVRNVPGGASSDSDRTLADLAQGAPRPDALVPFKFDRPSLHRPISRDAWLV